MNPIHMLGIFVVGLAIGLYLSKLKTNEGFRDGCNKCGESPCGCSKPKPRPICPACGECKQPDMSKYVLKSSIPPCPALPDMSKYILKSECPPVPDLSNYILKSSVPKLRYYKRQVATHFWKMRVVMRWREQWIIS